MQTLNDVKAMFLDQGRSGSFGMWEIIKVIREDLAVRDSSEVRRLSLEVVHGLLDLGMCAGASPYTTQGQFVPWPESTPDVTVDRIAREWDALGHDPNISDSPWFGFTEEQNGPGMH
jgi:hypothetical protein